MAQRNLEPPPDLEPPTWTGSWLGRREALIVRHGFTSDQLLPTWWNEHLAAAGMTDHQVRPISREGGAPGLTRGDLFVLASNIEESSPDDEYLTLLWHVLAWGSGTSRRNNLQRIAAFADPTAREERVGLLRAATVAAREGDTATAYGTLIRRGGGTIPGLGPAFFTKFLYFVGGGSPEHACLILDARVATSLHAAGWSTIPAGTYNWYTQTYVAYCSLLAGWAAAASATAGQPIAADEFERALFAGRPFDN
ncbi:hypothetical protein [Cellulosimicrobium protaetiae]|uniref:Uncharacterized protein n=1 Tax=Cellulosimicrobium protaetiae TaxID=2587808 RepID=A0A6M5UMW4_9MICO|nr:hypothetical protein [Cellulosimicrobium protaetiae]QJW38735.1 hypothetical protein FIC82_020330 [Cellulosimicrobium protaetiae]